MIDFGIIAAGDGERIKHEGSLLPKPLVDIDGVPMIGRLVSLMERCGARSVSVIVNSDMSQVWDYLNGLIPILNCPLKLLSKKTPSSMHSFYELVNVMKPEDRFVITTVDTIFREDVFSKYAETFLKLPKDIDGLMGVTSYIDDEKPLYVETGADDMITGYPDEATGDTKYISAGVYGLRTTAIPVLQNCMNQGMSRMRNFQRKLVEQGLELKAYDLGKVLDVDHISDIAKANDFLA